MKYFLLLSMVQKQILVVLLMGYAALFTKFVESERLLYMLSRLYEGCFVYCQYNYYGIEESRWYKELSYGYKLVCAHTAHTREMDSFLKNLTGHEGEVLSHKGRKKALFVEVGGQEYVVKCHRQLGFFKNLLQMGKAVTIWNNCMWAQKKGIPVEEAVAFVEKRRFCSVTTYVVYRYEGITVGNLLLENPALLNEVAKKVTLLDSHHVIHQDLRARNIIYTKEGEIKFIDIDILHYYPLHALTCKRRMEIEKRLFKEDCPQHVEIAKI